MQFTFCVYELKDFSCTLFTSHILALYSYLCSFFLGQICPRVKGAVMLTLCEVQFPLFFSSIKTPWFNNNCKSSEKDTMYVYLDFLFAKVGDLLIVGVLRQPFFYYYYLCIFKVPTFSSSLFGELACIVSKSCCCTSVVLLWQFLSKHVVTSQ